MTTSRCARCIDLSSADFAKSPCTHQPQPTPISKRPTRKGQTMTTTDTDADLIVAELAAQRVAEAANRILTAQYAAPKSDRLTKAQARSEVWRTAEGRALAEFIRTEAGVAKAADVLHSYTFAKARDEHAVAVEVLKSGFPQ